MCIRAFDFFFQAKNEYIIGHVPNTQNSAIEVIEISTNSEPSNIMAVIQNKKPPNLAKGWFF